MKITRIAKQEKRDRYNIFGDGKFVTALAAEVLAQAGLRQGDEIDPGTLEELSGRDEYTKALHKAYSYLSRRPHSRGELLTKLSRKNFAPELIEEVLGHLAELGYLNDEDFARQWVMERGTTRGPKLLRAELRKKRLSDDIIKKVLIDHREEHDLAKEAETLARKRLERLAGQPWEQTYTKLSAYLARRGYDYDIVRNVLGKLR